MQDGVRETSGGAGRAAEAPARPIDAAPAPARPDAAAADLDPAFTAPGGLLAARGAEGGGAAAEAGAELQSRADSTFDARAPLSAKAGVAAAVVFMFFLSFMLGKYAMTPVEVVQNAASYLPKLFWYLYDWVAFVLSGDWFAFLAGDTDVVAPAIYPETGERVLFNIRFPRIAVVMLVGAALAVAGASYQGMFKNPLTSPDLLGASSGASLGACVALLANMPGEVVQLFAFCGGMVAVGMAVWLNKAVDYDPTLGLVLAGILVSTLFEAGMSLVKFMADADDKLPTITFWLMGSFASVSVADMLRVVVPMAVGFVILILQSWKLNVLSFGDEEARAIGVDTARTRVLVIFAATLVTASSVAVAGIVGWIGLVIPHLARAIVGPNYKVLLPTSMFVGAAYLLVVDNIARLTTTVEIPIGILTAIVGVPFFVVIFKHNMKGWR